MKLEVKCSTPGVTAAMHSRHAGTCGRGGGQEAKGQGLARAVASTPPSCLHCNDTLQLPGQYIPAARVPRQGCCHSVRARIA